MKNLAATVLIAILTTQLATLNLEAQEEKVRVAKISFYEIKDELIEIILAKPENKELAEKYNAYQEKQKEQGKVFMKKALEAQKTGEMTIPVGNINNQLQDFESSRKVEKLSRQLFTKLAKEQFGDKYELILEGGFGNKIVYANVPIADITAQFRQNLISMDSK